MKNQQTPTVQQPSITKYLFHEAHAPAIIPLRPSMGDMNDEFINDDTTIVVQKPNNNVVKYVVPTLPY